MTKNLSHKRLKLKENRKKARRDGGIGLLTQKIASKNESDHIA